MVEIIQSLGEIFENNQFVQQVVLAALGVIFGGICTVFINKGAIRKQCKFEMQYKILSEESKNVEKISKKIEDIEISLSFGTGETKQIASEIDEVQNLLLSLNERLREKRKFVRKYLSAVCVEKSAQYATQYCEILYIRGDKGFWDYQMIPKANAEQINKLRKLNKAFNELNNDITESMEAIIEPGVFAKIRRRLRKWGMIIEECNAIRVVHKSEKKGR